MNDLWDVTINVKELEDLIPLGQLRDIRIEHMNSEFIIKFRWYPKVDSLSSLEFIVNEFWQVERTLDLILEKENT